MLPKLQQSSIAASLRRDNLASQIQCTFCSTQARTSSRESSWSKTTNPISHGRTSLLLKTRIVPSETSPRSTFPRRSWRKPTTNQFISIRFQDRSQSTARPKESEVGQQALYKKKLNFKNQSPSQAHSKKERCLHHNSADIMIEETCRFV